MEDQQVEGAFDDHAAPMNGQARSLEDDQSLDGVDDLYAKLNPRQHKAIIALVTEPTITKAAESAGVSESTVHRWMLDETFAKAHRQTRRETFSQAIALERPRNPHQWQGQRLLRHPEVWKGLDRVG